ncbi:hypothetical protein LguiA_014380 [Lonicera macranthoides]
MMGNWRRQKGDLYNQEFVTTKSYNKKPPLGSWQPTMPSWEKKFCKEVGCIPWYKIEDMKRYVHLYNNVVQWNDSAVEEAFHNAKKRFYAKIHGLACDIPLPDPDMYVDELDWNSQVDPELLLDLDREPMIPDSEKKYAGVVILDSLLKDQGFSSSGWGDCEEKVKKDPQPNMENNERAIEENGWGDLGNNTQCWDESKGDSGWGDGWNVNNNSWGQNRNENNNNLGEWGDGWNGDNPWGENQYENNNNHREWVDGWNSNNSWAPNKYENNHSRFSGEDVQRNHKRRNQSGRKKVNYLSEKQSRDSRPPWGQWSSMNNYSYAPVSRQCGKPVY